MKKSSVLILLLSILLIHSCSPGKHFSPGKKYAKADLQADFSLMRKILEEKHPSLYWYTSRDSMNMYFDKYYNLIGDSMTEQQFTWRILSPVISKIRCGHTSLRSSKGYEEWVKDRRLPSLPLNIKIWNDSMAVISSLGNADSNLKRGTIIKSINGMTSRDITRIAFDHMHADGYAQNFNYIKLSSGFPYFHRNLFGLPASYQIAYIDSSGLEKTSKLSVYKYPDSLAGRKQTTDKKSAPSSTRLKRQERMKRQRNLKIDSTGNYAVMTINTFAKGNLHPFFRKSFKKLDKQHVDGLIIDLRLNGGGKIAASTLLSRYVSREPFRIADTIVNFTKSLRPYTKYAKGKWLNNWGMAMMARKKKDGTYHISQYEKKIFKPIKKHHFNGNIIVLMSGPTFSASTLFCNLIKGQPGITLLGEESGGGWHGNNGIIIPDITLPQTGIRFRLPLFRLIQYRHMPKDGKGISPDIYVGPSLEALRKGNDRKMEAAVELIKNNDQKTANSNQTEIRN